MSNRIEIAIGTRFGRLVVIGPGRRIDREVSWPTLCDCGKKKLVTGYQLRSGQTQSCGCLGKERRREAVTKHGLVAGGEWHPLYRTWLTMKQRCYNPRVSKFDSYGARGIRVCDEWREDFAAFVRDVGPRPSKRHTIERIDNNGNYEPSNVKWATWKQQGRNKRTNVNLTFRGKTQCLAAWAEELGIQFSTLSYRIRVGWSTKDALTIPVSYGN